MRKQNGFTLIELVVVIAILGVLAAVALPRFMNATKDAHQAALKGTAGALAAGVMLARSQYELNRNGGSAGCVNSNCQIDLQGFGNAEVDVNANGWPIGTQRAGTPSAATAMTNAACIQVFQNVLQGSAPTVAASGDVDYLAAGSGTTCTYTYQRDGGSPDAITYNANTGEVTFAFN